MSHCLHQQVTIFQKHFPSKRNYAPAVPQVQSALVAVEIFVETDRKAPQNRLLGVVVKSMKLQAGSENVSVALGVLQDFVDELKAAPSPAKKSPSALMRSLLDKDMQSAVFDSQPHRFGKMGTCSDQTGMMEGKVPPLLCKLNLILLLKLIQLPNMAPTVT